MSSNNDIIKIVQLDGSSDDDESDSDLSVASSTKIDRKTPSQDPRKNTNTPTKLSVDKKDDTEDDEDEDDDDEDDDEEDNNEEDNHGDEEDDDDGKEDDDEDDEDEDDEEEDEENTALSGGEDESECATTELLAADPLYFVLSRFFLTTEGKSIANVLDEINYKLGKILRTMGNSSAKK